MEVIGCIFYMAFIFEQFVVPVYRDFGLPNHHDKPLHKMLVVGVFGSVIPCTFVLVLMFYCVLHSWLNACAELMYFADRMFYKVRITVTNMRCC
jgi:sterol O-acyltransferase